MFLDIGYNIIVYDWISQTRNLILVSQGFKRGLHRSVDDVLVMIS